MTLHELLTKLPLTDEQRGSLPGPDGEITVAALFKVLRAGGQNPESVTLGMSSVATTTTAPLTFGNRLRSLREGKGLTQTQLADAAEVHPQTVTQYEIGRRKPSLTISRKLAKVLEVTLEELVGDD